jgi:HK97 family phage portal protein
MIIGNLLAAFQSGAQTADTPETRQAPVYGRLYDTDRATATQSNQVVDQDSARKVSVVYRCENVLSDDIGIMPLQTYITKQNGVTERFNSNATLKNIAYRLEVASNDQGWMTPYLFKKMIIQWQLRWGNCLIWSPADSTRPKYLLQVDRSYPEFDRLGNLFYHTQFPNGQQDDIPAVEILHLIINPHPYGYWGRSVLTYARETIGRQLAAGDSQATIFARGINPAGIAWVPGTPNKETRKKIRESYEEAIGGSANFGRLAVMGNDEFTKFETISMKAVDMQFLETVQATDRQLCNFYGVPEYKVNGGKQSYESNVQQNLEYMKSSLNPLAVPIEQAARLKWLSADEQAFMFFRFNRDVVLQTDAKTRGETLNSAIQYGRISPNGARQIEDLPAYEGGDHYWMPANMLTVDRALAPAPPAAPPAQPPDTNKE